MKNLRIKTILFVITLALAGIACNINLNPTEISNNPDIENISPPTPTPISVAPIQPGFENADEPTLIIGKIPYTSPFFLNSTSEPFVLLEDEAGFVDRNRDFVFPLGGQVIGPVTIHEDQTLTYELSLPAVPQGTFVDVDNDSVEDQGVQIFVIAYWDNTWGGPFLEERDGTGWSTAYTSALIDANKKDEIQGGILVVWAPDDQQGFPTGFGPDGLLFTEDDPTAPIPPGYNFVNLDQEPFQVYKQARTEIDLKEGVVAVNDFSDQDYIEAFDSLFQKASREYPFTEEKGVDWNAIYQQINPLVNQANNPTEFYKALRQFAFSIPDGHVGLQLDPQVFFEENGGGLGLVLTELSDGRVLVSDILPGTPADEAGFLRGTEIISWNGEPVGQAISKVVPALGPYSTEHTRRQAQVIFLTRTPPNTRITVAYKNQNQPEIQEASMRSAVEYDSLFTALGYNEETVLPIEAEILQPSGVGYIRLTTFNDDYHLMAQLWERYIQEFIEQEVPGIIIDLRTNSGGYSNLANNFAGFFFDEEVVLYYRSYYNEKTNQFEKDEQPETIKPAPILYDGPIALLISPNCVSACEGFAYALQKDGRGFVVGHLPSAGAFGEVGRGQYDLPDERSMQFPTGRPEDADGNVVIEGVGILPDIQVPITEESAIGQKDTVLQAAIQALLR